MKPLELTVYPPLTALDQESVRLAESTGLAMFHTPPAGFFERKAKRLTEPELAAEYWMHEGEFNMVCEGYSIDSFGGVYRRGREDELVMQAQLDTLLRFATLPHYDEEPS